MSILVFDDSESAYEVGIVAMDQEGSGLGQGADLGDTLSAITSSEEVQISIKTP